MLMLIDRTDWFHWRRLRARVGIWLLFDSGIPLGPLAPWVMAWALGRAARRVDEDDQS